MRLINNHYPRVTSFSLLGAPIALAESLSAMHRANVISRTCVVFFVFFFFWSPPESDAKYADCVCTKDKSHPAG